MGWNGDRELGDYPQVRCLRRERAQVDIRAPPRLAEGEKAEARLPTPSLHLPGTRGEEGWSDETHMHWWHLW